MNQHPRGLHAEVRALYRSLLESQSHFDEFKTFLAQYPECAATRDEPEAAARIRAELNARIATWMGGAFAGLSVAQMLQWRAIVHDEDSAPTDREGRDVDLAPDGHGFQRHAG